MKRGLTTITHCLTLLFLALTLAPATRAESVTPAEARAIAKEAYIYGYPIVDNYRLLYADAVDRNGSEFKAPFNQIQNVARVATPEDKTVQTPNADTLSSFVSLDLRAEPIVLTFPRIDPKRYFSVQLVDLYTHNFDYIGSRATGNDGGSYLVAGPGWKHKTPAGIKKVLRAETDLVLAIYRTQLFNPGDLANVKKIQAGYKVQPLSAFLRKPAPAAAPAIAFVPTLTRSQQRTSPEFFSILAFALQFCPAHPSETALRERVAKLGVVPGQPFKTDALSPEMRNALVSGMADGQKEIDARIATTKSSADAFGTREFLKNNYLTRAVASQMGIYGNSKEEAFYAAYEKDADHQPLTAGKNRYVLRIEPGKLPPANAFWSVTMYELPSRLLVANPLNRYLVNSLMLPTLKRDADGGLTLYVQHESPGKAKEPNWLPAPDGPFVTIMRLYWPKPEVLEGKWTAPPLKRVE